MHLLPIMMSVSMPQAIRRPIICRLCNGNGDISVLLLLVGAVNTIVLDDWYVCSGLLFDVVNSGMLAAKLSWPWKIENIYIHLMKFMSYA